MINVAATYLPESAISYAHVDVPHTTPYISANEHSAAAYMAQTIYPCHQQHVYAQDVPLYAPVPLPGSFAGVLSSSVGAAYDKAPTPELTDSSPVSTQPSFSPSQSISSSTSP